jgi:hypothetical protein
MRQHPTSEALFPPPSPPPRRKRHRTDPHAFFLNFVYSNIPDELKTHRRGSLSNVSQLSEIAYDDVVEKAGHHHMEIIRFLKSPPDNGKFMGKVIDEIIELIRDEILRDEIESNTPKPIPELSPSQPSHALESKQDWKQTEAPFLAEAPSLKAMIQRWNRVYKKPSTRIKEAKKRPERASDEGPLQPPSPQPPPLTLPESHGGPKEPIASTKKTDSNDVLLLAKAIFDIIPDKELAPLSQNCLKITRLFANIWIKALRSKADKLKITPFLFLKTPVGQAFIIQVAIEVSHVFTGKPYSGAAPTTFYIKTAYEKIPGALKECQSIIDDMIQILIRSYDDTKKEAARLSIAPIVYFKTSEAKIVVGIRQSC